MTDRANIISMFESSIISSYVLPDTLVDQFLINATIELAYYIGDDSDMIVYTPDTVIVNGVFNRVLSQLEQRVLSLYLKRSYLKRNENAKAKEIGYATKNIATKDVAAVKKAIRLEIADLNDDIERLVSLIITPGGDNV